MTRQNVCCCEISLLQLSQLLIYSLTIYAKSFTVGVIVPAARCALKSAYGTIWCDISVYFAVLLFTSAKTRVLR